MTGANDGLASGGIASDGLASESGVNGATSDWVASGGVASGPGCRLRLVVVGASGFLGRHVRQRACAAGLDVVTAGRSPLPDSSAHCLIDLGAQDPARLAGTLSTLAPDVVVNCAGATAGPPEALAAVNVTGTYDLVRAMLMAGRPARLVHLGSAAEYGPGEPGTAVAESAPPRPASTYGATKLAGTRLVELGRAAGLDAVVLRVFNPVGPGAPDGILPGRLVSEFRRALADGSEVQLGPLDAVRDFVDARDVADAVIAAALAPGPTAPARRRRPGRTGRPRDCPRRSSTWPAARAGEPGPWPGSWSPSAGTTVPYTRTPTARRGPRCRPGSRPTSGWPGGCWAGSPGVTWASRWPTCGRSAVTRHPGERRRGRHRPDRGARSDEGATSDEGRRRPRRGPGRRARPWRRPRQGAGASGLAGPRHGVGPAGRAVVVAAGDAPADRARLLPSRRGAR